MIFLNFPYQAFYVRNTIPTAVAWEPNAHQILGSLRVDLHLTATEDPSMTPASVVLQGLPSALATILIRPVPGTSTSVSILLGTGTVFS